MAKSRTPDDLLLNILFQNPPFAPITAFTLACTLNGMAFGRCPYPEHLTEVLLKSLLMNTSILVR